MNTATQYLQALARHLAAAYCAHTNPLAILLVGSSAEGESDFYSDLDMSVYSDTLPTDAQLEAARAQIGATDFWLLAPRTETEVVEDYQVNGVECQVGHITRAGWEADMAKVLVDLDVDTPLQKALGGFLEGLPLHGEVALAAWRRTLEAYPDALARAMVEHYLTFYPVWYRQERFATRDMALWTRQMLVESAYNLLGTLAGLNRRYFTTFQFKRTHKFVATLPLAPPDLAARLDALLVAPAEIAIPALEALVAETVALVEAHLPGVDTTAARRRLGQHQPIWAPAPVAGVD